VLVATSTVHAQQQASADSVRKAVGSAIDSGNAEYIRGFANSDAARVAAVYSTNGGRLGENGALAHGTADITKAVALVLHQVGPITVTLKTVDLWVMENRAYETGKWTYAWAKKGGGITTVGGRYVTVWLREPGGRWRIEADVGVPE
jgi:ketosteroid isomerase-like protein